MNERRLSTKNNTTWKYGLLFMLKRNVCFFHMSYVYEMCKFLIWHGMRNIWEQIQIVHYLFRIFFEKAFGQISRHLKMPFVQRLWIKKVSPLTFLFFRQISLMNYCKTKKIFNNFRESAYEKINESPRN